MLQKTPFIAGRDVRARFDQLHGLYGYDQSLPDILDGLNTRLVQVRQLYGHRRKLPLVVSGHYSQLGELLRLYDSEST